MTSRSKSLRKKSKTLKNRKNRKSTRKNKSVLKKGGCGCNTKLFTGGRIDPPSFDKVPISKFYGQNNYQNDPQHQQIGSRTEP